MHLFKQYAVGDYDAAEWMIPVIDYGSYLAGERGALESVAFDVSSSAKMSGSSMR